MNNYEQPKGGEQHEHPHEQEPKKPEPRVYLASLSDYNAGELHGAWIDANQDPYDLHEAAAAMLASSLQPNAEEWAIHDYEGFGSIHLGEYETLETISTLATGITEHGHAYAYWADERGIDRAVNHVFEDAYLGAFTSVTEYVDQFFEDMGLQDIIDQHIPENLRPYVVIDSEGLARDLELSGDIYTTTDPDGQVHIFDTYG